jgi:ppGpp synthetase/RelA/SpoT-type nucleotidyltranferase
MTSQDQERSALLKAHGIDASEFEATGLTWDLLDAIASEHRRSAPSLQRAADHLRMRLSEVQAIHSLKVRIKDPAHLVAKIIRKKIERPTLQVTADDYPEHITDLIGLRALHLLKNGWAPIHSFVTKTWDLSESKAFYRQGDPEIVIREFEDAGLKTEQHKAGYRSVHYLLQTQLDKEVFKAELQVRTLIEESWSEIDHTVRYPRRSQDPHLANLLSIFNRVAGSADEIGTFVMQLEVLLRCQAEAMQKAERQAQEERVKGDKIAEQLRSTVGKLDITAQDKKALQDQIDSLKSQLDEARQRPALPSDFLSFASGASDTGNLQIPSLGRYGQIGMPASINRSSCCIRCGKFLLPSPFEFGSLGASTGISFAGQYCSDCKMDPLSTMIRSNG